MPEKHSQQGTDWSFTESARSAAVKPGDTPPKDPIPLAHVPTQALVAVAVPAAQELSDPVAEPRSSRGLLTQWKANQIERKAMLAGLEAVYKNKLDLLKHQLQRSVEGQKARADVDYEDYIKKLDAEHLEVLAELGLRNKAVRERTLVQLTDMTAAKLKEVYAADWPKELKDATINELFILRMRFAAEMMKELGGGA